VRGRQSGEWVDSSSSETTLRANNPKNYHTKDSEEDRIRDLRAKTQRELEWRASGCWIAALYILHYTCPVRGYP